MVLPAEERDVRCPEVRDAGHERSNPARVRGKDRGRVRPRHEVGRGFRAEAHAASGVEHVKPSACFDDHRVVRPGATGDGDDGGRIGGIVDAHVAQVAGRSSATAAARSRSAGSTATDGRATEPCGTGATRLGTAHPARAARIRAGRDDTGSAASRGSCVPRRRPRRSRDGRGARHAAAEPAARAAAAARLRAALRRAAGARGAAPRCVAVSAAIGSAASAHREQTQRGE